MRPVVGLVVNPSASRDIRRLTSLARTVDVHERVNQVARILQGLAASADLLQGGLGPVHYMPESCRVVERAHAEIVHAGLGEGLDAEVGPGAATKTPHRQPLAVVPALPPGSTADDAAGTTRAAASLARSGAQCVITVGGDGTNRVVAAGWPDAVICAVPGGTNNAFAPPVDPVAAGLAAGFFAADPVTWAAHARALPRLVVRLLAAPGAQTAAFAGTFALVDVAVVRGAWVGAHAVWDSATLVEAIVARADPTVSGLAGLAGMVRPLVADGPGDLPCAIHLLLGLTGGSRDGPSGRGTAAAPPSRVVLAPLGPGHLVPVEVRASRLVSTDEAVQLGPYDEPVTLAFDGEREVVVDPGTRVEVRIARSPLRLLDAAGLLRAAAERGDLLLREPRPSP